MCGFAVPHTVEHILANATEKNVLCLSIVLLKEGIFGKHGATNGSGFVHTDIHGLKVGLHPHFPIRKIIPIKHGWRSIPL